MKLKKLISLCISGSIFLSTSAFASETFDYSVDQENRVLNITYINSDFGKTEYGISVTAKGDDIPVYANQKQSDFGGIVKEQINLSEKGWYIVSVKPMGSKDAYIQEFAILDDGDLNDYWDILTNESDYMTIFESWEELSSVFTLTLSENTSVSVLSKVLAENCDRDFGERNDQNVLKFKSYLASEAELLAQLNKSKDADFQKTCELLDNSFLYIKTEDEVFYDELVSLFETRGEEIATLYSEDANSVYTFAGEYELLKRCVDKVKVSDALEKINKANHTSLISDMISDEETAKLLGIYDSLDEYLDLKSTTSVDKALYGKNFKNKEEFVKAFETALKKAKDDEKKKEDSQKRPSSGGGGGGGGFSSSPVTPQVGLIAAQGHPESDAQLPFADLTDYGWAKSAILSLHDKNIINGRGDSVFAPGDNVTRAEFAKMLILSLGITPSGSQSAFSDVSSDDWFASYVCTANAKGIVKGDGDKFYPSQNITREDASVMISRALSLQGNSELIFTDKDLISEYALGAVSALYDAEIISGMEDGSFAPKNNLTRAQTAVMLNRLIQKYYSEVN